MMNLSFEITQKCDWRCLFCYNKEFTDTNSCEHLTKRVNNILIKSPDVSQIHYTGGDPILSEFFVDCIKRAKLSNKKVVVSSNLSILTDQIISILKNNTNCVQVPLHSVKYSIFKSLTSFNLKEHLNKIIELRKNNIKMSIVFVANSLNYFEFVDIVEVCALLKIPQIIFNRVFTKDKLLQIIDNDSVVSSYENGKKLAKQYGINVILGTPLYNNTSCDITVHQLWVNNKGGVYYCPSQRRVIGNILHEPLSAIVNRNPRGNRKCIKCNISH